MKTLLIVISIIAVGLISCTENNPVNSNATKVEVGNGKSNSTKLLVASKPSRKFVLSQNGCINVKHNCIPVDIIVTPKAIDQMDNLDAAIISSGLSSFFSSSTNYDEIFPGLYGQALTDLQNGNVNLFRVNNPGTVDYVLHVGGTLSDYSSYY